MSVIKRADVFEALDRVNVCVLRLVEHPGGLLIKQTPHWRPAFQAGAKYTSRFDLLAQNAKGAKLGYINT